MTQKPGAPDWLIENIAEASKNARKIYFLYIGLLAYCALTVVSTSDRQIILNETARLPILDLEVSLNGFFLLTPLVAILVFVYFQLYLHRLKGMIDDLRVNYAALEKRRLYPWMINISEDPEPGAVGKLQRVIVKFSLWTSLPLVLILIALWYVKKHEPIWSYVVGSAPIVGTCIVVWFWCKYESVELRGFIRKNRGKCFLTLIVLGFEIIYLFFFIPWAFNASLIYIGGGSKFEQALIPWLYVDLSSQKLVKEQEAQHKTLYWVDLGGVHLEGGNLWGSILTRAYLQNANLLKAAVYNADLEGAILRNANLQAATLMGANLRGADLSNANLTGAWLEEADLEDAILESANLSYAHLQETLHLTVDQLSRVKTLYKAQLSPEHLERVKKDYPHLLEKPRPDVGE